MSYFSRYYVSIIEGSKFIFLLSYPLCSFPYITAAFAYKRPSPSSLTGPCVFSFMTHYCRTKYFHLHIFFKGNLVLTYSETSPCSENKGWVDRPPPPRFCLISKSQNARYRRTSDTTGMHVLEWESERASERAGKHFPISRI